MRRVGVACAVGVVLLISACGDESAQQRLGNIVVNDIDQNQNNCCFAGLHAYTPRIRISGVNSHWAIVHVDAKDRAGEGTRITLVMHEKNGMWKWTTVEFGKTGMLGCDVPKAVVAELHLQTRVCGPAEHLPEYVDCGIGAAKFEPSQLMVACGDGSFFITNVKWDDWESARAGGVGVGHLNDCTPDCAEGHFHTFSVAVDLSRPQTCRKKSALQFTSLKWTAVGPRPKGASRSGFFLIDCSLP